MIITYIYFAAYALVLGLITWRATRRQTAEEFLNSGKTLTASQSAWTTFASLLTGYNFVLGVTFSFLYGFWYLFAFIGAGAAFGALYLFYKKELLSLQGQHNLFSIGDYFGLRYGQFSKHLTNVIFCLGLVLFLTLQISVNTTLFSSLFGISQELALLFTVGTVGIYLWLGGFKASVATDVFQGILMLPIILVIFSFPVSFAWEKIPTAFDPSQFWFAIGLALLQFFSLAAQPESFQRVFAAKDSQALKKGLIYSFTMLAAVAGAIAYLGINFRFAGINGDPSTLFVAGVLPVLPAWLASLLSVSLVAAFMGTMDSSAFALGTLLSRKRTEPTKKAVQEVRYLMLGGVVVSGLASLYLFSFLASFFALISLVSVVGAALVLTLLYEKTTTLEINTFLLVGTIVFIFGLVFKFVTDNPLTSLIPSGAGLVAFLVIHLWYLYRKI